MYDDRRTYPGKAVSCGFMTVIVVLFLLASWFFFAYAIQSIHIGMAKDQSAIFEAMRQKALETHSVKEAIGYLECTIHYYPSGTKQETGSPLDDIVESSRRSAVRDILSRLRNLTNRDLGDDPESWIATYAEK
jgi:hypothetical protein